MPSGGARLLAGRKRIVVKKPPTKRKPPHGVRAKKITKTIRDAKKRQDQLDSVYLEAKARHLEMPLDFLLRVMRTSDDERTAMSAAINAAPYCHPKYTAIAFIDPNRKPGDNAHDITDVIDFFTRKIGSIQPGTQQGIIDATSREVGGAEVPVEGMVGPRGPTTAD